MDDPSRWAIYARVVTQFIRDWGALLVTVGLAVITGWYALLTRRIAGASQESADSARKAAEAAQIAAEATRSSAAAALADLEIAFDVTPAFMSSAVPLGTSGTDNTGTELFIVVEGRSATVLIHHLIVHSVGFANAGNDAATLFIPELAGVQTELQGRTSPVRLHSGERLFFRVPSGERRFAGETIASFWGEIAYSIAEGAPLLRRSVEWGGRMRASGGEPSLG